MLQEEEEVKRLIQAMEIFDRGVNNRQLFSSIDEQKGFYVDLYQNAMTLTQNLKDSGVQEK